MKKFEIGKEYFDRSACNHDCIFTIKIIKRTEKTVTFERNGKTRRAKLFFDERGEYIIPERYSMAPVFRAENEVQPEEEPSVEEAAAETSCGVEIVQPADVNTVVVLWWVSASNVSAVLAILRRAEPSSALLACLIPVSFTAVFSLWSCMTAQRLLNVSACPTFTAAGGALPAVLRWVCSSPDALPGRRFPPLRFSRRCIYRNGAKFFCFFAFSLLTLY